MITPGFQETSKKDDTRELTTASSNGALFGLPLRKPAKFDVDTKLAGSNFVIEIGGKN